MKTSYRWVAPCESCGQQRRDNQQDSYRQATAHSKAAALGYRYERLCAKCAKETLRSALSAAEGEKK